MQNSIIRGSIDKTTKAMRIHLWQDKLLDVKIHRLLFSKIRYSTHRRRAYVVASKAEMIGDSDGENEVTVG